ncbi:MAG: DMT family transporter, partial [Bdellovibrionales bacterium]|nr:DMT family transporter [Bdellovibrionales bacterium]
MKSFLPYEILALLAGAILAGLVEINGAVAQNTSATFSSLMNHLTGSIAGGIILIGIFLFSRRTQTPSTIQSLFSDWKLKLHNGRWYYLAGVAGAMVVICITSATNSPLGDVG